MDAQSFGYAAFALLAGGLIGWLLAPRIGPRGQSVVLLLLLPPLAWIGGLVGGREEGSAAGEGAVFLLAGSCFVVGCTLGYRYRGARGRRDRDGRERGGRR